ncbi:26452_t:CDS:1 [Gigaspora margarita]|uniref:26452_t:CDS:1 n=1 Tax=Gigaspora margarita TaxID=4874 RepID=A0ABN7WDD8_GIGMA|nr:26452_t:CDS:1 [Gigaspora margarita]
MVQFEKTIIPICLSIESEQLEPKQHKPKQSESQYSKEYRQLNNFIDTIIFENYHELRVDGSIDCMIRNSQLSVDFKLQLQTKRNMIYFYFDYVRQINEADYEHDLRELREEILKDKILHVDLINNLVQLIDKRIDEEFDL